MKTIRAFVATSIVLMVTTAQAHFVWAEFRATAKREVVVYFAEGPNDSVLDTILPKINSRLVSYTKNAPVPNTKLPVETTYPWEGTNGLFMGSVDYGVVDHGQGPYFLKYWYKAVSRPSQTSVVIGKGLELVAKQRADKWEVTVFNNGKPCPDAEIVWGAEGAEQKASAKTPAMITIPESPKLIPIRASLPTKFSGKFQDKSYDLQKEWTTMVLPEVGRAPSGADESAYLALQNASMGRESILKGSFGYTCSFEATDGTSKGTGTVTVSKDGTIDVKVEGLNEGGAKHVTGQVKSLFAHRFGGQFWKGEGKNPITWMKGSTDKVAVNDKMNSWYRLKNGSLQIVERTFGKNILTLDMKSVVKTPWGGTLSKEFTSSERNSETGKVTSNLVYKDDFTEFLDEWMPKSRLVTGTTEGHKVTMKVDFSDYKLIQ